jgi:hypothetical protein
MQRLSSRSTCYFKFALPIFFFCGTCLLTFTPRAPLIAALTFAGAFLFLVWFSLPFKNVTQFADHLRLGNYFAEIDIPLSHLVGVTDHQLQHPKFITLKFSPPTRWGTTIRLIPPIENFTWALEELNSILRKNRGPNQSRDPTP